MVTFSKIYGTKIRKCTIISNPEPVFHFDLVEILENSCCFFRIFLVQCWPPSCNFLPSPHFLMLQLHSLYLYHCSVLLLLVLVCPCICLTRCQAALVVYGTNGLLLLLDTFLLFFGPSLSPPLFAHNP